MNPIPGPAFTIVAYRPPRPIFPAMAVIDSISAPVPEAASTPLPKIDVAAGSRVVVAMSGGVDSSVTAAICKARGYEVVGITLQLYD